MNYWCCLRFRSPWVQEGGQYIVCLDESGGKESLDTLSHVIPLSHIHSGRTLAQITGCCPLRPLKMCHSEIAQSKKKKKRVSKDLRDLCHISGHRSAKEAWPNPCDCNFMDKHLSSATLEGVLSSQACWRETSASKHEQIQELRHPARSHAKFSVGFDRVEVALKAISVYFVSQNWLEQFR